MGLLAPASCYSFGGLPYTCIVYIPRAKDAGLGKIRISAEKKDLAFNSHQYPFRLDLKI